ncbi:MAG: hypothetical protein H7326_11940 [Bdellovibrionaceae bacterium]|nr:hypothetical protein [Pseudobdellovibrionaceae bacterium]
MPSGGGVITIPAGAFICRSKIIIKTDNVIVRGAGEGLATLRLAGLSPSPMLEIGNDKVVLDENGNWVTSTRVTNIEVSDLTIDGNLANQDPKKECGNGSCSCDVSNIRNNAITIRGASFVKLNRTHF